MTVREIREFCYNVMDTDVLFRDKDGNMHRIYSAANLLLNTVLRRHFI